MKPCPRSGVVTRRHPRLFHPRLEVLEHRLPLGEALLGWITGQALLASALTGRGSDTQLPAELSVVPASAVVETEPSVPPRREALSVSTNHSAARDEAPGGRPDASATEARFGETVVAVDLTAGQFADFDFRWAAQGPFRALPFGRFPQLDSLAGAETTARMPASDSKLPVNGAATDARFLSFPGDPVTTAISQLERRPLVTFVPATPDGEGSILPETLNSTGGQVMAGCPNEAIDDDYIVHFNQILNEPAPGVLESDITYPEICGEPTAELVDALEPAHSGTLDFVTVQPGSSEGAG